MPDRFTVGAVWMRAVAGTVGYDGRLAKALGFAYTIARRRPTAYDERAGSFLFAGLRFHESSAGRIIVCDRRFDWRTYDREVLGAFAQPRDHERAYYVAVELLDGVDVELLDTTDKAWRAYTRACAKADLSARFVAASKEISLR